METVLISFDWKFCSTVFNKPSTTKRHICYVGIILFIGISYMAHFSASMIGDSLVYCSLIKNRGITPAG